MLTVLVLSASGAQASVVLTTLHSFNLLPNGANPSSALVRSRDGNFYGTTSRGGTNGGYGIVFRISTNGVVAGLYSFTGGKDGANPQAALVEGTDGNFYGTTSGGGTNNAGTVFRIGPGGSLTSLYSFAGNDGAFPYATLVEGRDGNFYGTTFGGGTNNAGTVFRISAQGKFTSLYSFTGGNDGSYPQAALVQASDNNFYGTISSGGLGNAGTVFRLTIAQAPPVLQAAILTNRMLNLTWSAQPGAAYLVQYTSDLASNNWTNLNAPVTAAGATLSASDSVTNGRQRFYRAVLLP